MRFAAALTLLAALALVPLAPLASVARGAEPMMPAPQKEHEWLQKFIGEWDSNSKASMGPGLPDMECKGTITSKALGGFWIASEMKSEMMGMSFTGQQTIGYDAKKKAYVGTWVDSMTDHMWKYQGTVDKTGKILTLEAEGPNFMSDGKMTKFQDIYEFTDNDHIAFSSKMLGDDGKWVTFMSGTSVRKK